jgi:hypothetical protein
MSTSFGCNVGHIIESETYVGDNSAQETSYGSAKEIVCFGEVIYHYDNETHHLMMLRIIERRSSASSANAVVVLWCQVPRVPVFEQD